MITIVKEKDDFSANFFLETPGCQNFSDQKPLGEKSARLLAETNNRVIHRSKRVSHPGGSCRAAKDSLLQDGRQDQHGRASNEVVPEVTDVRRSEQDKDKRLRKERREKRGRSGNSTNKESCQKQTKDAAIEYRAQNVARFDQIFDEVSKRGDRNSDQTPRRRQRFRRYYIMMVARVRANQRAIKVDRRGRAESVQSCCCCRHGRTQDHCDQQSDNSMRHLLENESNEYVIRFFAFRICACLLQNCFRSIAHLAGLRVEFAQPGH